MRWLPLRVALVAFVALAASAAVGSQDATWPNYRDAERGFRFSYPPEWGAPGVGTDSGFGNRIAALRFANLRGLGGELALLAGRVTLDIQALGGLYDPITLGALPDPLQRQVIAALPPVTLLNVCNLLGAPDHLRDVSAFPAAVQDVLRALDHTRNVAPRVLRCDVQGGVVVFHKEATFETPAASTRQHIFGVVRFLPAPYSAVSLVRGLTTPPSDQDLATLARVIQSFVP